MCAKPVTTKTLLETRETLHILLNGENGIFFKSSKIYTFNGININHNNRIWYFEFLIKLASNK